MTAQNAYVHIPFCISKCKYCSFVSYSDLNLKKQYINSLIIQINSEYLKENLKTLYFGGGTPSLLSIEELGSLINLFNIDANTEVTVEVNPDSVDFNYLSALRKLGVNRLSIGVQTFDNGILNLIGRRHNSEQVLLALNCAKKAGFDNISLDFIYGLPTQSLPDFEADLKLACKLDINHISLYGLKIEESCDYYKNMPKDLPNSDMQADMYLVAIDVLKRNGFEHYEISNFSKKEFESKHNLNYWNNNTYYGFGASASGYIDSVRYQCEPDLQKYITSPALRFFEQKLAQNEILEEAIFLGLRKITGIDINEINKQFNINFIQKYSYVLDKYSKYFITTKNGLALTTEGILISNNIFSEFID